LIDTNNERDQQMARKGKDPGKMDTEKDTESKRRYQSPRTPPQAPRSSSGTQQGRGGEMPDTIEDLDAEDLGEGRLTGRGTSQEYGQGQRQGRGLSEEAEGAGGLRQGEGSWNELDEEDGLAAAGRFSALGSDFDLQKASRDELNAIARELDIEDFETMNREELVMEIRERS
jgi:hypothetical protein